MASSSAPFRRSGWSHSAENVITRSAPFQLVKGERQSFYINGNLHKGFPWLSYGNVLQAGRGSNTIPPLVGKCAGWFRSSFHKEGQTCSTTWLHRCSLPYIQEQGIAGKAATVSCTHFPRIFSAASSYVQGFVNLSARLIHIDLYLELYHLPGSLE